MPQTDEFRTLCWQIGWASADFARAAHVKPRTAARWWRGEQPVPNALMDWLRETAAAARAVPVAPNKKS